MNQSIRRFFQRFERDRVFWLVVAGIVLIYAVLQRGGVVSIITMLAGLVLAITVHECAHAWTADQLGDPTARYLGRISLNPLVHLDPMGTVMMVITALTGMGLGWGKPVPVSPHRLRYGSRLGNGIVALSGPASNLLLALVLGVLLRLAIAVLSPLPFLYGLLRSIVLTNIVIAFFNLIPLPPLDGHSVLIGLLSLIRGQWAWRFSNWLMSLERYGGMLLFGLIILSQFAGLDLLGWWIWPPTFLFYRLIMGPIG